MAKNVPPARSRSEPPRALQAPALPADDPYSKATLPFHVLPTHKGKEKFG
jgi:hypothetical protein